MESKHTQGEWEAVFNDYYWEICIPYEGESTVNKYCRSVAGVHGFEWQGKECAEANARLIAAAPDLLAALQAVNEYFTACAKSWAGETVNGAPVAHGESLDALADNAGLVVQAALQKAGAR